VLVDQSTLDDAGVFAFGRGTALVQTVDFFTPVVDDPYDFGRIAAANAVSDVYAMGGRPLTALALLCVPAPPATDPAVVREILRGGQDTMREAGVSIVGGHSVTDPELKFGYSVTGVVERRHLLTNAGVRPGDRLLLTKPLGTGVLATALKQGRLSPAQTRRLTRTMASLNRAAAEAAVAFRAHAATDVTGYGLVGHAAQLADASGVTLRLRPRPDWFLPRALELAADGAVAGGLKRNRAFFADRVGGEPLAEPLALGLHDPQTSGGLLIACAPRRAGALVAALRRRRGWVVEAGEAVARGPHAIEFTTA
jgi:selenide,water dikinase